MKEPNYEELTQEELRDVLDHIDKEQFKGRYNRAKNIFDSRGGLPPQEADPENYEGMKWLFVTLILVLLTYVILSIVIPEDYFSSDVSKHGAIRIIVVVILAVLIAIKQILDTRK